MLIGVDVSPATKPLKTGIEWYCYHVARELTRIDSANRYRFYSKVPLRETFGNLSPNVEEVVLPGGPIWTHTALAWQLLLRPVDVFYTPSHVVPWWHPKRTIYTIHDVGFRNHRRNYSLWQNVHSTTNTRLSIPWAQTIVVPSEFVADDLCETYKVKRRKVAVVPNGFDPIEFALLRPDEIEAAKAAYGITGRYFVFVGRMDTRKNLLRTAQAFFDLDARDLSFVLIGAPGIGYEKISTYIASRKDCRRIITAGYVSPREKAALLAGSQGLIFPSLHEGFGIPILEGFAANVPVLTSTVSSCPEVAGGAAVLVNPLSKDDITRGMASLLNDECLRRRLISAGRERMKQFSWEKTASQIHALLTDGLDNPNCG
jgi:glycosyltransferase involved in cell wall biosynthesis